MPSILSSEDREALVAQLEALKRDQSEFDIEALLDTQARLRFGMVIYRAIDATRRAKRRAA
jgi:hypothetical protein